MKAIGLTRYLPISNPESLMDVEIDKPAPSGRDLLVKVEAIGVNPVDTKVRAPKDKVEETPRVLGWDASGGLVRFLLTSEDRGVKRVYDDVQLAGAYQAGNELPEESLRAWAELVGSFTPRPGW